MKKIMSMVLAVICSIYAFSGCVIDDGQEYSMKSIGDLLGSMTSAANVDFMNSGIDCYDENGKLIPHTVEDYKKLSYLSEDTLMGYYRMLHEDKVETEKLVCALGYESWDDFLTQKGHLNDSGEADIKLWEEAVYIQLQKKYDEMG